MFLKLQKKTKQKKHIQSPWYCRLPISWKTTLHWKSIRTLHAKILRNKKSTSMLCKSTKGGMIKNLVPLFFMKADTFIFLGYEKIFSCRVVGTWWISTTIENTTQCDLQNSVINSLFHEQKVRTNWKFGSKCLCVISLLKSV